MFLRFFLFLILFLPLSGYSNLDFDTPKLEASPKSSSDDLTSRLSFSGIFRMWALTRPGSPSRGPEGFFLMQAEPIIDYQVSEDTSARFSYNLGGGTTGQGTQDAYVTQNLSKINQIFDSMVLGQFYLPFGIDLDDHTVLVRTVYQMENYRRDVGVQFSGQKDFVGYDLVFFNGGRNTGPGEDGKWGVLGNINLQVFDEPSIIVGASALREIPDPSTSRDKQDLLAFYTEIDWSKFHLKTEVDIGRRKNLSLQTSDVPGAKSMGYFMDTSYDLFHKLQFLLRFDAFSSNTDFFSDQIQVFKIGFQYRPVSHWILEPAYRKTIENKNTGEKLGIGDSLYLLATMAF